MEKTLIAALKTKDELTDEMGFLLDKIEVIDEVIVKLRESEGDYTLQIEVLQKVQVDFQADLVRVTGELCALYPLSLP